MDFDNTEIDTSIPFTQLDSWVAIKVRFQVFFLSLYLVYSHHSSNLYSISLLSCHFSQLIYTGLLR